MYFNRKDVILKKINLNESYNKEDESPVLNIAYGIDKNFLFGCAISIASILLNNKNMNFVFHVFTDYFEDDNVEKFKELAKNYNTEIIIYIVNCDELKKLPSTKNWSYATYFRFIIADYLYPDITRILYLDADIVCKGSLSALSNYPLDTNFSAVVAERDSQWWSERSLALGDERIKSGYFNAGFLLINLIQWNRENISENAMNLLSRDDIRKKISYLDQDILNLLFVGKTIFLSEDYNQQFSINYELTKNKEKSYSSRIKNSTIFIHYIGPTKPWHEWAAAYPSTHYFMQAKKHSPWRDEPLIKPITVSNFKYCSKHYFYQGKKRYGIFYFIKYLIKKTIH
ncbi:MULTISPECIES: lipopolysaccharide 3-alpha-galactosyltransferase [Brenneria]|uniref:Lipopolysaccharide 3-alpha-galactosyltransferase n=1 Tax=Brenneria nigrifluens DSM 30175 = ATCC 13028 TaxID=1121120 RepID=A0A2U1UNR6_9GAMM|nr:MULTISPECIES: lipopolysaccharide 3-alpha-galactosyltransferase [Brenneria]EHD19642.1 Lipopolysaccharide 3-alpha-galactosyltransferase [Brenneria sp. EniD312]PWC23261.1 lipopolysaccharide 3-alpha-galactosyltransferase [Brenneria nigrifluens DSM 30175 = ATCC 13028]QCR02906.1 lipopolysaccharide 3-alpha-galactosyltransferase [Brenneria nigrifluens DSM 30175 = ATCC 13028]